MNDLQSADLLVTAKCEPETKLFTFTRTFLSHLFAFYLPLLLSKLHVQIALQQNRGKSQTFVTTCEAC